LKRLKIIRSKTPEEEEVKEEEAFRMPNFKFNLSVKEKSQSEKKKRNRETITTGKRPPRKLMNN